MAFERRISVYNSDEGILLKKGQARELLFDGGGVNSNERLSLFVTGETALQYLWKNEPDYPAHYRTIDDALDAEHAEAARYCLTFSNVRGENYVKRVYKKIPWPPALSYLPMRPLADTFVFGARICADNLIIKDGGYLRMCLDVHFRKDGVHPYDVSGKPDKSYELKIPAGSYPWQTASIPVEIPAGTAACAGVWIEGEGYAGGVWFEKPFLTSPAGYNLLPDFMPPVPDKESFDWSAQNLSRKEWPEFRVKLNNRVIYEGEQFERCHRRSEWSVAIPGNVIVPDANLLSIELISNYRDPLPYTINEVSLIARPNDILTLIHAPEIAPAHGYAHILIRTGVPDARIKFESAGDYLTPCSPLYFKVAGLNAIKLKCGAPAANAAFMLRLNGHTVHGSVERIVEKTEDGVLTGTGDMIYVRQDPELFEEYLSWYMANNIGNLLTIRPTYRWSGSRTLNPDAWLYAKRILNGMGVKYAHMVDGRELPGKSGNPTFELLSGEGFLGRQDHERDGAQFYWGPRASGGSMTWAQYYAMEQRIYNEAPEQTSSGCMPVNYFYKGDEIQQFRPFEMPGDVMQAADFAIRQLSVARGINTRHTGPSAMFKYFYQAGYEWVGAETMYGSMEPLMAFLRGASLCYGKKRFGVHHAVQWSSSPHDTPARFRRYRLALYVSYMQGASEINTEEGLWRIEEYYSYFHRFSGACMGHLRQQQEFYRYVASHSRKGNFYAPMALLHGRLDGWHAFGRGRPWGVWHAKDSDAEKSWDLLKVFYPLSKPGETLYIHDCPNEPVGYHTGTPYGNVDVTPVESDIGVLSGYKALAFVGYNYADAGDLDRLLKYVEGGGALLFCWAHLSQNTALSDINAYRQTYMDHPLLRAVGGSPAFAPKRCGDHFIDLNINRLPDGNARVRADDGTPVVIDIACGKGVITLVNAMKYPSAAEVRPYYEDELRRISGELNAFEPAYIECGADVQFAIYDLPGERHIYVLAVDWYNDPAPRRRAVLRLGGAKAPVEIPFGVMYKIVAVGSCAAWALSEDGEVLRVDEDEVAVQGYGIVDFAVARAGAVRRVSVDFTHSPVQAIRNR